MAQIADPPDIETTFKMQHDADAAEIAQLKRRCGYYELKISKLHLALPYWLGFLSEDEWIETLVAWVNAHRFSGPSNLESSWRMEGEIRVQLQERIAELEAQLEKTNDRT